jgi:biopolymer transport protein ExbD
MSSNKLRNAKADDGDGLAIDMSPMIDMVFLLLIFFLVNATMIIVQQDPNVEPPIADKAKEAEDGKGRIVINIYEDGEVFNETGKQKLETDEAIKDYIKQGREAVELQGFKAKLHLRGDKRAVFKHSRKVIRLAAEAEVEQVVFATYGFAPN